MRNLSQATYDHIRRTLDNGGLGPSGVVSRTAARDLLEAYESAVQLLDNLLASMHAPSENAEQAEAMLAAEDFLYDTDGCGRVELVSFSARGLVTPSDANNED